MKKKSLEFHITSDDYFGILATVLDLLRQNLKNLFALILYAKNSKIKIH